MCSLNLAATDSKIEPAIFRKSIKIVIRYGGQNLFTLLLTYLYHCGGKNHSFNRIGRAAMRFRFQFGIKWCVCVNRLSMANQMRHWRPVGSVRPMRPLILIALRTLHTISSRGNSLSGWRQAAGVIESDMSLEASLVFVAQFSTTFLLSLSLTLFAFLFAVRPMATSM